MPQGGILSPALWNIYIRDVESSVRKSGVPMEDVHLGLYADDVTVAVAGKDYAEASQRHAAVTGELSGYFSSNLLDVNGRKSRCMWMNPPHPGNAFLRSTPLQTSIIHAGGRSWPHLHQRPRHPAAAPARSTAPPPVCFPTTDCLRVLGVHIDSGLTFAEHVSIVIAKAQRRVNIMRRLASTSWGCKHGILRTTYKALVENAVGYGIAAWGGYVAEELWARINVLALHPGMRQVTGLPRWCRIEALYAAARSDSAQNLFTYKCAQWMDHTLRAADNNASCRARLVPQSQPVDQQISEEASRALPPCLLPEVPFYPSLPAEASSRTALLLTCARHGGGGVSLPAGGPPPTTLYTPNA